MLDRINTIAALFKVFGCHLNSDLLDSLAQKRVGLARSVGTLGQGHSRCLSRLNITQDVEAELPMPLAIVCIPDVGLTKTTFFLLGDGKESNIWRQEDGVF